MVRHLQFLIKTVEGLFYLHRENKTFDQQFIYCAGGRFAAVFHIGNQQSFLRSRNFVFIVFLNFKQIYTRRLMFYLCRSGHYIWVFMGTNCAPLVADLFLYCYERDFMDSLNHDNQADVIEAFNSTSRYLDDLLNIDNPYFEGMVNQIYPPELQLNKANISDTEAPFLDLHLSVANGFVSSKI